MKQGHLYITLEQIPISLTITLMYPKFAGDWVTNLSTYSCTSHCGCCVSRKNFN